MKVLSVSKNQNKSRIKQMLLSMASNNYLAHFPLEAVKII